MESWILYTLAGLITGLGFFVQRLTGFGSALIATPFLVVIWDAHNAINLQLIYQLLFGAMLLLKTWRSLLGPRMMVFTIASIPTLIAGSYFLPELSPRLIQISLGIILVIVILQWIFAPNYRIPRKFERPAAIVSGILTGTIHGIYGTGGPFLIAYCANVEKDPAKIRDGIIAFFSVANFVRLPVALSTSQINSEVLTAVLYALVPFLVFMYLGRRWAHHINISIFRYITIAILAFAIFSLIWMP